MDKLKVTFEEAGYRRQARFHIWDGERLLACSNCNFPDLNEMKMLGHVFAAAPELLSVLREIEWANTQEDGEGGEYDTCPCCGGGRPDDPDTPEEYAGHDKDCALYVVVAKAEGRKA